MPSFIQDDSPETKKKRKETKESSKPKKQQRTLASFFGKKAAVQKKPPPPPEPSPAPPPLNEKRKAEVMRIVMGKQRKTKKVADADKRADEEQSLPNPTKPPDVAVSTEESTEAVDIVIADETSKNEVAMLENTSKEAEITSVRAEEDSSDEACPHSPKAPDVIELIEIPESPKEGGLPSQEELVVFVGDETTEAPKDVTVTKEPEAVEAENSTSQDDESPKEAQPSVIVLEDGGASKDTLGSTETPSRQRLSPKGPDMMEVAPEDVPQKTPTSKRKTRKSNTPTNIDPENIVHVSAEEQERFAKLKETYSVKGEALLEQFRQPCPEPTLPETDQVDVIIATLIDGSHLPLSLLSAHVKTRLESLKLSVDTTIEEKIKLLATRKQMIKASNEKPGDLYETDSLDWRWEVQIADLILCKKERTRRKRLANHYHAVQKLLNGVEARDVKNISNLEEKVLKFEREAEKQRLAAEAKLAKELEKERKQRETAKRKEKEAKAKRQKQLDTELRKLEKKAAEQRKKDAKAKSLAKQESVLKSFLAAPKRAVLQTIVPISKWNADQFRQAICSGNVTPPFERLTERAKQSRVRRSRIVDLKVLQTVEPENPFSQEPQYAEQTTVRLKNKFQFLCFREDVRPPYWGTWSKRSKIVTGRTPFGQDSKYLDYENDSEAEWEEGDDEMGEDLADNDMDEDEVEEPEIEGENDGWLAADDDDGDKDGEDLVLRYIAPSNGLPSFGEVDGAVMGYSTDEARALLEKLTVIQLSDDKICYTVEPPSIAEDETETEDVLSDEHMAVFVRFVHNNSLGSRDKLIDEFLRDHKSVVSSRAQILRILDSIAEKTKDPLRGTLWVVSQEVRDTLGLRDLGSDDERKSVELMKQMASFIHHNTAASKDKLADEVRDRFFPSKSRADVVRLVQSIADKKKINSSIRWVVKSATQAELKLELPDDPDGDHNFAKESIVANMEHSTVTPTPTASRTQEALGSLKEDSLGSSNLLQAFTGKTP